MEGDGLSLADLQQRSRELSCQQRPSVGTYNALDGPNAPHRGGTMKPERSTPFSSSVSPLDVPPGGGGLTPPDAQHFSLLVSHFRQVMSVASQRLRQYEGTLWSYNSADGEDGALPRPFSAGGSGPLVGDGTTLRLRAPGSSPSQLSSEGVAVDEETAHAQCREVLDVLEGLTGVANAIETYLPQGLQANPSAAAGGETSSVRADRTLSPPHGASSQQPPEDAAADRHQGERPPLSSPNAVLGPADALRTALLLHSRSLLLRDTYLLSSLLHAKPSDPHQPSGTGRLNDTAGSFGLPPYPPQRRRLAQGLMLLKQSHQAVDAHYLSASALTLLLPYPAARHAFADQGEETAADNEANHSADAPPTVMENSKNEAVSRRPPSGGDLNGGVVELGDPAEQALYANVVRHTKNAYKCESRLSVYAHQIRSAILSRVPPGSGPEGLQSHSEYADLFHLAERICEEFNILRGAKNDIQLCVLQAHAGAYEASLKRGRKAVEVLSTLCQQYKSSLQTVDSGGVLGAADQAEEVHAYVLLPVALYNLACTVDLLARRRAVQDPSSRGNPERREARDLFFQAYQLAEQFLGGSHEMVHELMRLFGVQRLERWKARTRAVEQHRQRPSLVDPSGMNAAVAAVLLPEEPSAQGGAEQGGPGRAGSVTLAGPFVSPQQQQRIVLSSSSTSASSFGRPAPPPFTFQPATGVPPLSLGRTSSRGDPSHPTHHFPPPHNSYGAYRPDALHSSAALTIPQRQNININNNNNNNMLPTRKPPHHLPIARPTHSNNENDGLRQLTPAASDPALVALMLNPSMGSTNVSESQNPSPTAYGRGGTGGGPAPPFGPPTAQPPRPTPASLYQRNRAGQIHTNHPNNTTMPPPGGMMLPNANAHNNMNIPPTVKGGSFLLSSSNLSMSQLAGSGIGGGGTHHPRRDMFANPQQQPTTTTDSGSAPGSGSPLGIPAPPNAVSGMTSGIAESIFSAGGFMSESGNNESSGFNRSASSFQRSMYNGRRMSRSAVSELRSCHRLERPDDALSLSGPTPEFIPPNPTKEAEIAKEKEEQQQKKRERRIRAFLPEDIERKKRKKEEKEERRRRRERHERKKEIFARKERERAEAEEKEAQRQAHAAYYAEMDGGIEIGVSGVQGGSGGYGDGPSAETLPPTARGEHPGDGLVASGSGVDGGPSVAMEGVERSSGGRGSPNNGDSILQPVRDSGEGSAGAEAGHTAKKRKGSRAEVLATAADGVEAGGGRRERKKSQSMSDGMEAAEGSGSLSGKRDRHQTGSLSGHSPPSSTTKKKDRKGKPKGGVAAAKRKNMNISNASNSQSQSMYTHERLDTARPGHRSGSADFEEEEGELSSLSSSTIPPSSDDDDGDDDEEVEEEEETVEERKDRYDVEMQIYFLCLHRKREKAACVIQRAWRCSVARLELYNRRQFFYHHLYIQQKAAALCIIGFMRATLTRKRLQDRMEHRAAEDVRRAERERQEMAAVHTLEKAFSRFLVRKHHRDRLRKELNLERDTRLSKYEAAAVIVQRWWRIIPEVRAYWKRRAVEVAEEREARAWEELRYNAATRIQALVRGRQGRRQARRYKAQRLQEKEEKQRRLIWSTDLVKLALTEWCLRTKRLDHQARLEEEREYEAVQCITHGWQNALARRRFELALAKARQIRMAAETIQRAYKRHYASRERRYLRELSNTATSDRVNEEFRIFRATITLQCFARVVLAKAAYRRQRARYGRGVLYALTVLQSVGRGCLARRSFNIARVTEYERRKAEAETAEKLRQRNMEVLQAFVLARDSAVTKEKKACQRLYDKIYIRRLVRQELKREKAAVAIQQAFRRYRKLKVAFIRDYQEQCAAAAAIMAVVKIQCAWRQWRARQTVRKLRWFARKAAEKRLIKEEVQAEQWVTDMHFFFKEFEHDRRRITNLESDLRDTLAWVYKKETNEMIKTHLPGLRHDAILEDDNEEMPPMNVTAALEGYLNNEYVKKWCSLYDDDDDDDDGGAGGADK